MSGARTKKLRIGYARIFHEGNAFSPLPTTKESFERFHFFEGEELSAKCTRAGHELKGFLRQAELSGFVRAASRTPGVETVPLLSAMAVPSGKLTPETLEWLRERLRERLRAAGGLDAVYLALHGSMQVEGLDRAPEGVLLEDVKNELGDLPVAASFDLHANMVSSIADRLEVLTAYRTNPHRDLFRTGYRAGAILMRSLSGELRPTHAWRKLPVILGGGSTVDFLAPMRSVFRFMRGLERDPKVLGAHLFMVHPYSESKELGWAIHVTTDDDPALAERVADRLADRVFAAGREAIPEMMTTVEALAEVKRRRLATRTGAVSLVDVSDVVGAGAPGGNTRLARELLEAKTRLRVYVPIQDSSAVELCWEKPLGSRIDVVVKGVEAGAPQEELPIHGVLAAKVENESGRVVRLDVGSVSIALTERSPVTIAPRFWKEIGLSPFRADAIVQKTFFHYRFFYLASNRGNLPVATEGATSFENILRLPFDMPVLPKDSVDDWRAFDRAKRARVGAGSPPGAQSSTSEGRATSTRHEARAPEKSRASVSP